MFGKGNKDDPNVTPGKVPQNKGGTNPNQNASKATGENFTFPETWTQEGKGKGVELPDLIGEVIGYKYFECKVPLSTDPMKSKNRWGATNIHRITSPVQRTQWNNGNLVADKIGQHEGGIYAFHSPSMMRGTYGVPLQPTYKDSYGNMAEWEIATVIQAWGDIYVYSTGFRAEFARIVLMAFDPAWPWEAVRHYRNWALEVYGCKCVPYTEMEDVAKRYGESVPESLRPK